jgi:hypothetical protein
MPANFWHTPINLKLGIRRSPHPFDYCWGYLGSDCKTRFKPRSASTVVCFRGPTALIDGLSWALEGPMRRHIEEGALDGVDGAKWSVGRRKTGERMAIADPLMTASSYVR